MGGQSTAASLCTPQISGSQVYVTATGMFGEPEAFVELPPFADFVKEHDQDKDGQLSFDEVPDDLVVITAGYRTAPETAL